MDDVTDQEFFLEALGHPALMRILNDISRGDISSDDDDTNIETSDMPLLEPISSATNIPIVTEHDEQETSIPSLPSETIPSPDVNNSSLPELSHNTTHASDDDSDSMPDLQPISDSSGSDTDEVEMMHDLEPVDDDNDSSWTDSDINNGESAMPPLEPIQPRSSSPRYNRRARVEDDDDQDRDRRHPSQRVAGTTDSTDSNNINQRPAPPVPFQIRIPTLVRIIAGNAPLPPFESLQRPQNATTTNTGATQPQNTPGQRPPRTVPVFTGGFTFTVGEGVNTWPVPGLGGRNQQPGPGVPRPFNGPPETAGFTADTIDLNMFADFLGRFGMGLGQALGLDGEEQEDPERAKRLVNELEEVPIGLVRRLEQVGGAPGSHVDEEDSNSPGCAICWDKLLDVEGDGFGMENEQDRQHTTGQDDATAQSATGSSPSPQTPSDSPAFGKYPKIVCLPCAHVFHATCLIPWFSRPNQTTCPTCRFNIDPENLTYVRRPRPQTQADPTQATQTATTAANDTPASAPPGQENDTTTIPSTIPPVAPPSEGAQMPTPEVPPNDTNIPANQTLPTATPPDDSPDGGLWTFGFDVVFEQSRPTGEGGDQGQRQSEEQTVNNAMDVDNQGDANEETGQMRREAEAIAQQFLDRMGLNMAPATPQGGVAAGNANPIPDADGGTGTAPPADTPGTQPNAPFNGFPRMFQAAQNAPLPQIPVNPQFVPGNAFGQLPPGAVPNRFWRDFTPLFATGNPRGFTHQSAPRERKEWSLPPAPGPTLRQRIEQKERDVGLRCFDMSCGVGPSDEEPTMDLSDSIVKQLQIRPSRYDFSAGDRTSMCSHTFHPACLVSAERVAMKGAEEHDADGEVEVTCPVCRAAGFITTEEWQEGVSALA